MTTTRLAPYRSETDFDLSRIKKLIIFKYFAEGQGFSGYFILPSGKEVLVVGMSAKAVEEQNLRFGPYLRSAYHSFRRRFRGAWA